MFNLMQSMLSKNLRLKPDQPLLVGVSGGMDSMCLLDVLLRLKYPVVVAHFNHRLRPEASDDARMVAEVALTKEVPFVLGEGSAADYARDHNLSIEEAARELRYRFLFHQAEIQASQAVAVAHNADDQVETVLMHLLRGAGLDGLTGMSYHSLPNSWSQTIPLVRPFLGIWRAEIETYCAEHSLRSIVDQTNTDTTYFRNRMRHELIPELEAHIPGLHARLWQTADLLASDRNLLDELTDQAFGETMQEIGDEFVRLHPAAFKLQPLALRRRLIRKIIAHLRPGARDVDYALVQRALDFISNPTSTKHSDLGLKLQIALEENSIVIADWHAGLPTAHWPQITDHYSLPIPGTLDLNNGWILKAEISSNVEAAKRDAQDNHDPLEAWVDFGGKDPLLNIRPRFPGERFQPLGMEGKSMKISDFMINEKIPQRARTGWPLVCAGGEVVWIPGYRLAHAFRIRPKTHTIVRLSLRSG